ncbi:MAG TPA: [FeFe] hydrogenase H-cluster radical SAM maturase HydG [Dissulfurispiraceae bacterium]|nr:[FeFe] hydrogenase H-cluster radical SAM maturase HydG [Dissulfurispiraceae bacterium]
MTTHLEERNVLEATATWLDEAKIRACLAAAEPRSERVAEILQKAADMQGLKAEEVSVLMNLEDPALLHTLFRTAEKVKEQIYGPRIVLFAPLYVSNRCVNECSYCAFRAGNSIERHSLSRAQVVREVEELVRQGHKRVLLVAGEDPSADGFQHVLDSIAAVYTARIHNGEIRRVNVNIAPLTVDQFRRLKQAGIGTYQLFQETYHRETYEKYHTAGPKKDFLWRVTAFDRAMEAGIDDVGIGVLFGLYDWRFEVLAMLQQIRHLEERFGIGPHTISVPRLEPADGSSCVTDSPYLMSDADFKKAVAILRLAVPYTGIIMSTRENAEMRCETLRLGVSQISAGSRTDVGGYAEGCDETPGQFELGDHRSLEAVVRDLAAMGYVPSFCTACYRMGRTGMDFMDLAKPGEIKTHCDPNALSTFMEYLLDYAAPDTRAVGETLISRRLAAMDPRTRAFTVNQIAEVQNGRRDVFV